MNGSLCSCLFVVIHLKEAAGGRFCGVRKYRTKKIILVHRFKMISQMPGKTAVGEEEWI